ARRTSDNQVSTGCGSVFVDVTPLPQAPSTAASDTAEFCAGTVETITLSATGGSGSTLRWYSGSCGGTLVGSGSPLVITAPAATTTYFARWENSCGSSACVETTVSVYTADFDGSGFVDIEDYTAFVLAFEAGDDTADFDGSGFVDIEDFTKFVVTFEQGC
ncbi:MAG: hypothetical protein L6Q35_14215, partial [Phycisphaerales bacterium]|nr:hypothetical protein [Phycisphaerales bacterium]